LKETVGYIFPIQHLQPIFQKKKKKVAIIKEKKPACESKRGLLVQQPKVTK
jgi:hypothetical protein